MENVDMPNYAHEKLYISAAYLTLFMVATVLDSGHLE